MSTLFSWHLLTFPLPPPPSHCPHTFASPFMAKGMPVMMTPRPALSEKSRPSLTCEQHQQTQYFNIGYVLGS